MKIWTQRDDVAEYIDALQRERTGLFRHAYREHFCVETDYEPNQEPLYVSPRTRMSTNSQVLELEGLFRHCETHRLKVNSGSNPVALHVDLGNVIMLLSWEKTGLFRHAYREGFSVDANYDSNAKPLKLV